MHEPDRLDKVGIGDKGLHPYVSSRDRSLPYFKMYAQLFNGYKFPNATEQRAGRRVIARWLRNRYLKVRYLHPYKKTLILKSVYSLQNTEWIYENLSVKVVVLLRHPCSVIHSILRNWPDARLKGPHLQPEFVKDYLGTKKRYLEDAKSVYEVMASRIAAYYCAALTASNRHPSWIVISHEQLCSDPIGEFRTLYKKLGLDWDEKVESAITATNRPKESDHIQHVNRVSFAEIDKWKSLLTKNEIAEVARYYCPFELPYYTDIC